MPDACPGFITDLLVRCGRGDEAALGRLFDLFHRQVSAAMGARGGSAPLDEQVLEVFVRLWQQAPRFEAGAMGPVAWVMALVAGAAVPVAAAVER
jgi:DNA-directed RNA polymerase specialized sigma24 family protein